MLVTGLGGGEGEGRGGLMGALLAMVLRGELEAGDEEFKLYEDVRR